MVRWYRKGFDTSVALNPAPGKVHSEDGARGLARDRPSIADRRAVEEAENTPLPSRSLFVRAKAAARHPIHWFFRCIRPLARPLAYRWRGFMDAGTQGELAHLRALLEEQRNLLHAQGRRLDGALAAQIESRQMVLNSTNHAFRHLHLAAIDVIQEIQAARDLLEGDIERLRGEVKKGISPRCSRTEPSGNGPKPDAPAVAAVYFNDDGSFVDERHMLLASAQGYILCGPGDWASLALLSASADETRSVARTIATSLQPGDVFVEVGAKLGVLTLVAARAMSGEGSIIAIEPDAGHAALLERTLWLNGFGAMAQVRNVMVPPAKPPQANTTFVTLDDMLGRAARVDVISVGADIDLYGILAGARGITAANANLQIIATLDAATSLAPFIELGFNVRVVEEKLGPRSSGGSSQPAHAENIEVLLRWAPRAGGQ